MASRSALAIKSLSPPRRTGCLTNATCSYLPLRTRIPPLFRHLLVAQLRLLLRDRLCSPLSSVERCFCASFLFGYIPPCLPLVPHANSDYIDAKSAAQAAWFHTPLLLRSANASRHRAGRVTVPYAIQRMDTADPLCGRNGMGARATCCHFWRAVGIPSPSPVTVRALLHNDELNET